MLEARCANRGANFHVGGRIATSQHAGGASVASGALYGRKSNSLPKFPCQQAELVTCGAPPSAELTWGNVLELKEQSKSFRAVAMAGAFTFSAPHKLIRHASYGSFPAA